MPQLRSSALLTAAWMLLVALAFPANSPEQSPSNAPYPWAVCYTSQIAPAALDPYKLLVLDSEAHVPLTEHMREHKVLLGYLSLGEVENYRPYYGRVQQMGILVGPNPSWPDSYFVDMRDARWSDLVLRELVPSVLRQGFHGVFLDTLDDPIFLESSHRKYRGMTAAAAELIRRMRKEHPDMPIMMNRAFELLPEIGGDITMVLAESIRSDYDAQAKRYRWLPDSEYMATVSLLEAARKRWPSLLVYSLDYWDPNDRRGLQVVYSHQRDKGFLPYVATLELDRIVPEPAP